MYFFIFLFDGCELRTSNMSYEAKREPPPPPPKREEWEEYQFLCGGTLVTIKRRSLSPSLLSVPNRSSQLRGFVYTAGT